MQEKWKFNRHSCVPVELIQTKMKTRPLGKGQFLKSKVLPFSLDSILVFLLLMNTIKQGWNEDYPLGGREAKF